MSFALKWRTSPPAPRCAQALAPQGDALLLGPLGPRASSPATRGGIQTVSAAVPRETKGNPCLEVAALTPLPLV